MNLARSTALASTLALVLVSTSVKSQATADEVPSATSNATPEWQARAGGKMGFEVASIHLAGPGKFTPPRFALETRRFRQGGDSSPISHY